MSVLVQEAEAAITQAMLDGSLDNIRLQHTLRQLDRGRWRMELTELRQRLARSPAPTTAEGLQAVLAALYRRRRLDVASAQVLAIGFYRLMWRQLRRLDRTVTLDELRGFAPAHAAQVCYGFTFGLQPRDFPLPPAMVERMHGSVLRFMAAEGVDRDWREDRPLPLGSPLVAVSDRRLSGSANAIRNTFFAQVFTKALLADRGVRLDDVVLTDLLFAADHAPGRIGFLRRMPVAQARFRLRQLALAVIALHHQACASRSRGGPLMREIVVASLLSPFVTLRSWLRANRERLWIPLVRLTPDGDPLVVHGNLPQPEGHGVVAEPPGDRRITA